MLIWFLLKFLNFVQLAVSIVKSNVRSVDINVYIIIFVYPWFIPIPDYPGSLIWNRYKMYQAFTLQTVQISWKNV